MRVYFKESNSDKLSFTEVYTQTMYLIGVLTILLATWFYN